MTKTEFLVLLESRLDRLSQSDILRTKNYYSEMIDDRLEDGMSEEDAIADLGPMDKLVEQILRDAPKAPVITSQPTPKQPRTRKDKWVTALCILAGCIVIGFSLVEVFLFFHPYFFPFGSIEFGSDSAKETAFEVTEPFSNIDIRTVASVDVTESEDGLCRVVLQYTGDKVKHIVTVENDTLIVQPKEDSSQLFYLDKCQMTVRVYLPKDSYEKIYAEAEYGDVDLSSGCTFQSAELISDAGEVYCGAYVTDALRVTSDSGRTLIAAEDAAKTMQISSDSGDVEITTTQIHGLHVVTTSGNVAVEMCLMDGDANIKTVSGSIRIKGTNAKNLNLETDSGTVNLTDTLVTEWIRLKTVSGGVQLDESDANLLEIETDSGDVTGTLCSEKWFITQTDSGAVSVQNTPAAKETCQVTTVSGNILIGVN